MFLEKFRLDGKTTLVTGGGRGIGLACSRALAEAGAAVVIAEIDLAVGDAGKAELAGHGLAVDVVPMDVTRSAQVDAVAEHFAGAHHKGARRRRYPRQQCRYRAQRYAGGGHHRRALVERDRGQLERRLLVLPGLWQTMLEKGAVRS